MLLGTILRPVQTGGDGIGLLLIEDRDGLGAQLGATDSVEHVVERKGHVGAGQRELAVIGVGERQTQVLNEVLDHKAGFVVAIERLGRQALHGAGLAGAAQDHLTGLLQIKAAQLGKRQRIGHADHAGAQRHLVGELGSLALASTVEAADVGRKGGKDVADRGDVVLGGAHDGRERAGDSTGLAAGDGAVKRHAAGNLGGLGNIARELGRARGEVDQDRARLCAREQAVARQVELLDLGGITHHGKDDVGVRHGICRRIGPNGTALDKRGGLGLSAVVDRDGIAGIQDVAGNGGTHDSGADKCDGELVCHETFPFGLGVITRLNTRCQRWAVSRGRLRPRYLPTDRARGGRCGRKATPCRRGSCPKTRKPPCRGPRASQWWGPQSCG